MAFKLGKCRLCLKLGDFFSIFSMDSSLQLAEMAMSCAQVKIYEGDGLPDKVCSECVAKLSSAYLFKQQCERSDQELRRNYVPPPGSSHTPPPNRQSSDSGYSNRTDASAAPKKAFKSEEIQPSTSAPLSNRKRKRISDEPKNKNLLQESFSFNVSKSAGSDNSRPKTPDKRSRYEQDSDYEYNGNDTNDSNDSNSIFKCEQCDRVFGTKKSLGQHKRIHTKDKESKSPLKQENAVVDIKSDGIFDTPRNLYSCPDCGKSFKLQIMLKRHDCSPNKSSIENKKTLIVQAEKISTQDKKQNNKTLVDCLFCDTPFPDYYNYVSHFTSCPDYKDLSIYQCRQCSSKTNRKNNFFKHIREKHFMKSSKPMGTEIEIAPTFECRICSQNFASQDLLVTHLAAHMSNIDDGSNDNSDRENSVESNVDGEADSAPTNTLNSGKKPKPTNELECQFCFKKFSYVKSLHSHIAIKHSDAEKTAVKSEILHSEEESEDDGDMDDNTCDICEKQFSYRKTLLHHKATKHPVTAGHKISTVKFDQCKVICIHCNMTMLVKEIKAHNQVHINANIKPKNIFTCYECGSHYKSSQALRNHIKVVHRMNQEESGKGKYQMTDVANFCEVVVTKSEPMDSLQDHNDFKSVPDQSVDGMKPVVNLSGFTCPLCNKTMPTLISLKRHINWHSNVGNNYEAKHQCKICNAEFKFNSHYKLHMKEHYYDTTLDPKFLTCTICKRKSKHLRAAQAHSRWHKQTRFNNKDYQCSICKKIFQFRKVYLSHMAIHYKKGESIDTSKVHTKQTPGTSEGFKCHFCDKVLDSEASLKCHVSWHKSKASLYGDRYECEICHMQFTNKRRQELHIRTHYEDENGPYKCPICGKGYNNELYYSRHVKGHNFDHQSHIKKREKLREMRQKKVQCPICCRYYPDLLHLVRHIRRSHPESKMIKQDPDAAPEKVYPCKLCAKIFLDEKRLQMHEESHLRKPIHLVCKFCGMKNISMKNHNVHVKGHLTKKYRDQPLECSQCQEKFVLGYALHHHLRDAHGIRETWATERPVQRPIGPLQQFQCSLCYKVLTSRLYYERHLDYHNSLRCNYCFEYFNGRSFLNGHLEFSCEKRKLIGDTEVHPRKTKCPECFKAFHLQVKLECHLYTQHGVRHFERSVSTKHDHICDYCFRVFDNEDALTGHKLYHRTPYYYGCRYCTRKFSSIVAYNKHKTTHLAQMCIDDPIKCDHCDERFDWFRDMIYHMRDIHGDDKEWIVMPKEVVEEECGICHKRFYNVSRHLRHHEDNRCRKCREYFYSRVDFDAHLCHIASDDEPEPDPDDPVTVYAECKFCFKQTSKTNSMLKHDLLHKTSGSLSCRFCPRKFKTIDTFNIHAYSHRTSKYRRNPLACPMCDERFVQYGPLIRHMRDEHKVKHKMHYRATVVPEPCVVCHETLPNLHNHYRAHLQNRCQQCLKYFVSGKAMLKHACDKEDADPSKVFTCDVDLQELIKTYTAKEVSNEIIYYKTGEPELLPEEPPPKKKIKKTEYATPTFSVIAPIISDITSLKQQSDESQKGNASDDDDCVIIMLTDEDTNSTQPDVVCLD